MVRADAYVDHALISSCGFGHTLTRNAFRETVLRNALESGMYAEKEKPGLLPPCPGEESLRGEGVSGGRCPADVWLRVGPDCGLVPSTAPSRVARGRIVCELPSTSLQRFPWPTKTSNGSLAARVFVAPNSVGGRSRRRRFVSGSSPSLRSRGQGRCSARRRRRSRAGVGPVLVHQYLAPAKKCPTSAPPVAPDVCAGYLFGGIRTRGAMTQLPPCGSKRFPTTPHA